MRVLITGGTGFIGGATARALLARGDQVVVLTRSEPRGAAARGLGAILAIGDVRDATSIARAASGCDVVVHSAGLPKPSTWRQFRAVHVEGTHNVIAASRRAGAGRIVHVASQAVMFGGRDLFEMREEDPYPRHIDPYSATKAEGERLALAANGDGIEVTSLRPAVVWGRGDTTVLPIMARLARSMLGIPMCGPGTNIEATTHIANLVDATLLAIDSPRAPGRAYLVADSFRVEWKAFLAALVEAAGVKARFTRIPRPFAHGAAWLLDHATGALGLPVPLARFGVRASLTSRVIASTRARDELGYVPRVGLADGLADLRAWITELGGAAALLRSEREGGTGTGPAFT